MYMYIHAFYFLKLACSAHVFPCTSTCIHISKARRAYEHKDYVEYLSEHEGEGGAVAGVSRLKQHLTLVKEQHCIVDLGLTEQEPQ